MSDTLQTERLWDRPQFHEAMHRYAQLENFDLRKPHCMYFAALSAIPRPSCGEQAAASYVQDFAKEHGLYCQADRWGNTIIRKAGSPGREQEPWLMLQAHLDMVPAVSPSFTAAGGSHDWTADPLDLYTENGFLMARGTTLGADDGVGAAYMLAILADPALSHPPLECVFTVMEEIGLVGALKLKPEDILSRRVISLDGGGETASMCCAAGGIKGEISLPVDMTAAETNPCSRIWTLTLSGFQGGHSGIEISRERGNAILLTVRFLSKLEKTGHSLQMAAFDGGSGDNVIPAACTTRFFTDLDEAELVQMLESFKEELKAEYRDSDPDFSVSLFCDSAAPGSTSVLTGDSMDRLLSLLTLLPNGVQAMSIPMPGIPVTSNNIGTVHIASDSPVLISFRARSLLESGMDDILRRTDRICRLTGAQTKILIRYPGWNYQAVSPMRDALDELVRDTYGIPLTIEGTHGGNETGIWYGLHPDSDIVSIGSIEENIHTPEERLDLAAFDRMYTLLVHYIEVL